VLGSVSLRLRARERVAATAMPRRRQGMPPGGEGRGEPATTDGATEAGNKEARPSGEEGWNRQARGPEVARFFPFRKNA
jgi:hypothetical protein